jgi:hypothetical protein
MVGFSIHSRNSRSAALPCLQLVIRDETAARPLSLRSCFKPQLTPAFSGMLDLGNGSCEKIML